MTKPIVRGILMVLAAAPAALALAFIFYFGVDSHTGDEWDPDMAGVFIKAYHHQVTFGDLVSLHNEHRLLVPRLLYILLNVFTKWNNFADVLAAWVIFVGTSLGVLRLIQWTDGDFTWPPRPGIAGLWFVSNVFVFAPPQFENWLSAWGLANALPGALTVAAILAARTACRSWARLALCMLPAVAATFSNGCGFLTWGLAGLVMAWSDSWQEFRGKGPKLIAWAAALALCAALYFHNYHPPAARDEYRHSAALAIQFITLFAGNSFLYTTPFWLTACPVIGAILLAAFGACVLLFAFFRWSGETGICRRMVVWLAAGGFGLGTAILGMVSRAGYGLGQGSISRYVSFSIFLPLALVNLTPLILRELERRWSIRIQGSAFLAGALLSVQVVGLPAALDTVRTFQAEHRANKGMLLLLNILPKEDKMAMSIHLDVPELRREANEMDPIGFLHPRLIDTPYADLIRDTNPKDIDGVKGHFDGGTLNGKRALLVNGWAAVPAHYRLADKVILTYQDANDHSVIFASATMGVDRGDVAKELGDSRYELCGWNCLVSAANLPAGFLTADVRAWVLDADTGKTFLLPGGATVTP
jgi:hypothetical protein